MPISDPSQPLRHPRAQPAPGPEPLDLVAEDLATLALDLARERTTVDLLNRTADAVVAFVPGARQAVVTVLRHEGVELCAATGPGAEACEAWQLALWSGPAPTAAEKPGTVVRVDDLTTDPRWTHLQASSAPDALPSILTVAAALPVSMRRVVLSWYGPRRSAFLAPDCARVALLTAAHVTVALDSALREDHLHARLGRLQNIAPGAFRKLR